MFFSEEFINKVEQDPVIGVVDACNAVLNHLAEIDQQQEWTDEEHEILWESAAFINLFIESNELTIDAQLPEVTGDVSGNCTKLQNYIVLVKSVFEEHALKLRIESYTSRYKTSFKNSFAYEFSQGDLDRIQIIVNELRNQISESTNIDPSHKQRLLKRLETLQSELHKRVSDLDRFWGLVGDAGVILGKLGKDAKPIVDRVKEIAEIAWKTQARTEELPSGTTNPVLGDQSKNT